MKDLHNFERLIDNFFHENSREKIDSILRKYDEMEVEGPKVAEYFKSLDRIASAYDFIKEEVENGNKSVEYSPWDTGDFLIIKECIPVSCSVPDVYFISNYAVAYNGNDDFFEIAA